ncbi:SpoIIE family protein phosphatase [Halobacteriovorax sp. JY17]|uniref:SpoIIE family protein phosphatase n=1 Tax=Halobacteriovorax sp. JY17 TaxID=2014617 RepID=UPI0025BD7C2C|nr:SpoIIE family protein phosphatase [Halobacteriovorax sp. JY17]
MTGLLVSSISLYAIFALGLFEKDKSAYIYGNSSEANVSFNQRMESYLNSSFEKLHILSYMPKDKIKNILSGYEDVFHLELISSEGKEDTFYNISKIEDIGLSVEEYKKIIKSYSQENREGFRIINDESTSFLFLKYKNKESGLTLLMYLNTTKLEEISSSFSQYESYILNLDGTPFWGNSRESYLDEILESKLKEATIVVDKGSPKILSFKFNTKYSLVFITEILRSEAYKVNDYLIGKSKVFGLVVLSLSGFIALLFSRSLTSPIEKLYDLTLSISKGEFNKKADIHSRDEIGALGDSINYMSEEILRYMDEMKEKARLENEIETAKYVQSTYFPEEEISLKEFSISSFYKPASECGGDWWGYVEDEDRLVLLITDATGHGVPAALLTATAHCCLENLKQNGRDILKSPAAVLEFMNTSIQCLEGKMLMTAFCSVLDKKKGKVIYANASHNPPLFVGKDISLGQKNNFKPLLGSIGPRLGHKEKGDYKDEYLDLSSVDRILFFTDGILESKNKSEKEYGQRRFLKSLNGHMSEDNSNFRKSVVQDAFDFYEECPIDDDITIVSVSVNCGSGGVEFSISDDELESELKKKILLNAPILVTDKAVNLENTFYISNLSDNENVLTLKNNPKLNHLVGRNSQDLASEILHNMNNCQSNLSLGEYLDEYRFHNTTVKSKEDFLKINNLLGTLDVDGYFESPIDYLKIISNELLTNAIYHSGEGELFNKRSTMERSETPVLSESESIDYSLAVGANHIAICVIDFTGRLNREVIINNLERSFREREHQNKDGGAGLGLFLAFSYSNQFIVRTHPGKRTEVICIIEKNKRFKTYKERVTSFHYFEVKEEA